MTDPTESFRGVHVVPRELAGMPLDRFLSVSFPDVDRGQLRRLVRDGRVLVDGVPVSVPRPLRRNAVVTIESPVEPEAYDPHDEHSPLAVLFEDAEAVVVDKPAGTAIAPERVDPADEPELARARSTLPRGEHLRVVNRLERDASGAVLVTKTLASHRAIEKQLDDGTAEIEFLAIVEGDPREDRFEVRLALGPDRRRTGRRVVDPDSTERCITRFEVLARFDGCALVAARPVTHRTHQIRVHLADLGTPLLVDPVYGHRAELMLSTLKRGYRGKPGRRERPILTRLSLHARRVGFTTAKSGVVRVESPVPPDLERVFRVLDHYLGTRRNGTEHS